MIGADGLERRLRRRDRARLQRLAARLLRARTRTRFFGAGDGGAARRRRGGRRGASLRRGARLQGDLPVARRASNRRPWHHPRLRSAVGRVRAPRHRRSASTAAARTTCKPDFSLEVLRQADDVAHLQPAARHHDGRRQPHRRRRVRALPDAPRRRCSRATARGRRGCFYRLDEHYEWVGRLRGARPAHEAVGVLPPQLLPRPSRPTRRPVEQYVERFGDDNLVFSTDYPHADSKYPARGRDLPARCRCRTASQRKILWDNWCRLYDVPPPAGR